MSGRRKQLVLSPGLNKGGSWRRKMCLLFLTRAQTWGSFWGWVGVIRQGDWCPHEGETVASRMSHPQDSFLGALYYLLGLTVLKVILKKLICVVLTRVTQSPINSGSIPSFVSRQWVSANIYERPVSYSWRDTLDQLALVGNTETGETRRHFDVGSWEHPLHSCERGVLGWLANSVKPAYDGLIKRQASIPRNFHPPVLPLPLFPKYHKVFLKDRQHKLQSVTKNDDKRSNEAVRSKTRSLRNVIFLKKCRDLVEIDLLFHPFLSLIFVQLALKHLTLQRTSFVAHLIYRSYLKTRSEFLHQCIL